MFPFSQNIKISQILTFKTHSYWRQKKKKKEQVITYRENNNWYCQGDSHQHSQTDNEEEDIGSQDSGVGMKQFWLDVFYGERRKTKTWCAVFSGD